MSQEYGFCRYYSGDKLLAHQSFGECGPKNIKNMFISLIQNENDISTLATRSPVSSLTIGLLRLPVAITASLASGWRTKQSDHNKLLQEKLESIFGASELLDHIPGLKVLCTKGVFIQMHTTETHVLFDLFSFETTVSKGLFRSPKIDLNYRFVQGSVNLQDLNDFD